MQSVAYILYIEDPDSEGWLQYLLLIPSFWLVGWCIWSGWSLTSIKYGLANYIVLGHQRQSYLAPFSFVPATTPKLRSDITILEGEHSMHILKLPNELLMAVAESLLLPKDLRSLLLTNRRLYRLLTPLLKELACTAEYTPTALFWAAACGDEQFVRFLLEKGGKKSSWAGPDVSVVCPPALFWATVRGDEPIVHFLLGRGEGYPGYDVIQPAIIHRVSEKASDEVVAYVLEEGANLVLGFYYNQYTSLHWAMDMGHLTLARLLLEKGIKLMTGYINYRQYSMRNSESVLHLAIKHEDVAMFNLLLGHGADVHSKNFNGDSTLHVAAEGWNGDILVTLLERGVYVDSRDANDRTPLFNAVEYGKARNARVLLEGGADINAVDDGGRTAAQRAATLLTGGSGDPGMFGFRATREQYHGTLEVLHEYLGKHIEE